MREDMENEALPQISKAVWIAYSLSEERSSVRIQILQLKQVQPLKTTQRT